MLLSLSFLWILIYWGPMNYLSFVVFLETFSIFCYRPTLAAIIKISIFVHNSDINHDSNIKTMSNPMFLGSRNMIKAFLTLQIFIYDICVPLCKKNQFRHIIFFLMILPTITQKLFVIQI